MQYQKKEDMKETRLFDILSLYAEKYPDQDVALAKKGNYMVFFPSYALMNKVYQIVYESEWSDGMKLLVQENIN